MKAAPHIVAPDPDALLRQMSRRIDDAMLVEIARADYGYDMEAHLAPLRRLRDEQIFPTLHGHPREVLELTRWIEPDYPDCNPAHAGPRGHWMRAFASATLLRGDLNPGNEGRWGGVNETLVALLMSLDRIELRLEADAAAFVAAYLAHHETHELEERAFFGVALLWLALQLPKRVDDAALIALCEWTCEAERIAAEPRADEQSQPAHWLLRTVYAGQRHHVWQMLGARLAAMDLRDRGTEARQWVALIGESLAWREG